MDISFEGKSVVVTGASRGIGRSIALAFADCGANVSICARGAEALKKTEAELKAKGGKIHAATCDLADAAAITQYVKDAASAHRRRRRAGQQRVRLQRHDRHRQQDDGRLAHQHRRRSDGDACALRRPPSLSRAQRRRSIIHISSIAGLRSSTRLPPYGAVKAALIQYTRNQAARFASEEDPGQLHRARLDRVCGRRLGQREDPQSPALQERARRHSVGPSRPPEEIADVACLPRQRPRELDDRADDRSGRRTNPVPQQSASSPLYRPMRPASAAK
jgi:3-oxoacyl-[acyl-carrier protein] reductase